MTPAAVPMVNPRRPHVVLFFTKNTSLAAWAEAGMLERELTLYARLIERGFGVRFVTYGARGDHRYARSVPEVRVVCNRWNLPEAWYRWLVTTVYPLFWGRDVVIKSNQMLGADTALRAARVWGRPFVARCGYLHAEFTERLHGAGSTRAKRAVQLEKAVFSGASRIVVTTDAMADKVSLNYALDRQKIRVIPNYVDTTRFSPAAGPREGGLHRSRLVFVGRLIAQKNLPALFEAIEGLEVELVVVGNDALMDELRLLADTRSLPVTFAGAVPNSELPGVLRSADIFVLPSWYEGHPKALLEAMACGLAVLGTDVPGIREVITHRENGWLCGTAPADLRAAIQQLLLDAELRRRLGDAARRYVVETCSLDRVVDEEARLMCEVAGT